MQIKISAKVHKDAKAASQKAGMLLKVFCERAIEKEIASIKVRERTTSKG